MTEGQRKESVKVNFQILIGMCTKAHRGYKNADKEILYDNHIIFSYMPVYRMQQKK